ncbi:MAG: cell division protein ZapA [Alphaproteobacteria bacterium]|jgi:cell division protein ZapA|nr:cell division protein ZapA [Rhodospirillaceae bacterium]MDP6031380.1 cell division protein ZapA [Alphaproteobacteria bacterium]MDP7191393.1 cell division protein ZapA [Alphaproteobacteria bacterium]MDP7457057.1 cell division protein ZapA [Alphaproteobacteria bacterium]HJO89078.1 cell division protein ZapA [Alphaproteobacteria bacterium]|tara:strand:- start:421 stop:747 length:327 start_codon:yes stop_codon:yes gene_type:complete
MSQLSITINSQNYTIACDDGQEDRIQDLAMGIDQKVQDLVGEVGQVGDNRLLVMAGLLVADELAEMKESVGDLPSQKDSSPEDDKELAEGIDHLAQRIEAIASRLEQS